MDLDAVVRRPAREYSPGLARVRGVVDRACHAGRESGSTLVREHSKPVGSGSTICTNCSRFSRTKVLRPRSLLLVVSPVVRPALSVLRFHLSQLGCCCTSAGFALLFRAFIKADTAGEVGDVAMQASPAEAVPPLLPQAGPGAFRTARGKVEKGMRETSQKRLFENVRLCVRL